MQVLHVLNGLDGGATVSIRELVRESRAQGTGIRHYAVLPGGEHLDCSPLGMFEEVRPVPMGRWYQPEARGARQRLIRFAEGLRGGLHFRKAVMMIAGAINEWGIDLVATNCAANLEGAIAARRTGRPHVWHIRERVGSDGSLRFRIGDHALAVRIGELSAGIAAVSNYVARPFVRAGLEGKVEVVYDGIDLESFKRDAVMAKAGELRRRWLRGSRGSLVGSVANVTGGVKRHHVLLEAFAELARSDDSLRFVVIGRLPRRAGPSSAPKWERWQRLRRMSSELGLEPKLTWAGYVEDIPAAMNSLDVLVHACEIEGLGRVVLEAMAAAKPVVLRCLDGSEGNQAKNRRQTAAKTQRRLPL